MRAPPFEECVPTGGQSSFSRGARSLLEGLPSRSAMLPRGTRNRSAPKPPPGARSQVSTATCDGERHERGLFFGLARISGLVEFCAQARNEVVFCPHIPFTMYCQKCPTLTSTHGAPQNVGDPCQDRWGIAVALFGQNKYE